MKRKSIINPPKISITDESTSFSSSRNLDDTEKLKKTVVTSTKQALVEFLSVNLYKCIKMKIFEMFIKELKLKIEKDLDVTDSVLLTSIHNKVR